MNDSICPVCRFDDVRHVFTKNGFDLFRCERCRVIFVHPFPDKEVLGSYYDESYHEHMLTWDASLPEDRQTLKVRQYINHAGMLFKRFDRFLPAGGDLLEIGCAGGFFLYHAQRKGWRVTGIEANKRTAALAENNLSGKIINSTMEDAELPDNSFDAIVMWDVIEHLYSPVDALKKAHAALKPGGTLALTTPNSGGLFPRLSFRCAGRLNFWPHPEPPFHLFQFSEKNLTSLLAEHHFKIDAVMHDAIHFNISFGPWGHRLKTFKRAAYFSLFALLAIIGPYIGMGDVITVFSRKES